MTRYLVDTNILILFLRQDSRTKTIESKFNPFEISNTPIISVVTVAELRSIALQRNWGVKKIQKMESLLRKFLIADVNVREIIDAYAEIDAFSQNKLLSKPLNASARNMGKNDIWIAATAHVLGISLLTTDKDFHHLDEIYLNLAFFELTK